MAAAKNQEIMYLVFTDEERPEPKKIWTTSQEKAIEIYIEEYIEDDSDIDTYTFYAVEIGKQDIFEITKTLTVKRCKS